MLWGIAVPIGRIILWLLFCICTYRTASTAIPPAFGRYADRIGKGKFRGKVRFWSFIAEKRQKLIGKLVKEGAGAKLQQNLFNELAHDFDAMLTAARNPNKGYP